MSRERRKQLTLNRSRRRRQAKHAREVSNRRRCGTRYGKAFRKSCLQLLHGGMTKVAIERKYGVTAVTLGRWEKRHGFAKTEEPDAADARVSSAAVPADEEREAGGQHGGETASRAPHDNVAGLSQKEIDEILVFKKQHLTMGPAQIRAQLRRYHGWRISIKAIARALKAHGYHVEHRSARDERELMRFEAPYPNSLWMMDALAFRVHEQRLYLSLIIDDFSRFIVGYSVGDDLTSDQALATLTRAIAEHGKPQRLLTDRGGQFLAVHGSTKFQRYLETELIDHSVSRPYHPQTLGKVESVNRAIQKELIYVREMRSAEDAKAQIEAWIHHFNFRRAHLGIDGLVPADRYFGLHQRVLAEVQARSRDRLATAAASEPIGGPLDDVGGPLEILRFALVDGRVEVRFCGQRAVIGKAVA